jgi:hypothetical protein
MKSAVFLDQPLYWGNPNIRVTRGHKDHLIGSRDNLIANIQKELAVETGKAPARFFPGLKREALVTIISAGMQRYANFARDDARHRPSAIACCSRLHM